MNYTVAVLIQRKKIRMRASVTIPVFNEEAILESTLTTLHARLPKLLALQCEIVVADNGSTDGTHEIASRFAQDHCRTKVVRLSEKGRGRALKHVWLNSDADILAYMDADLSSDLEAFPKLIEPLV